MEFSNILKHLRVELSLSQKEIADGSGLSPQCISQLEAGIRNPTGSTLSALADYFQCSTDYLLGREDDFGNISIYQNSSPLSDKERKMIDIVRRFAPQNISEWITLYCELPSYMQESIFAELKGMHLGYTVSKKKKTKEN